MVTIYKREMGSYFRSPVAYCLMGFFMVIVGIFFVYNNINNHNVSFADTLKSLIIYLAVFAPLFTMKLLADERRNNTEVLLRTSPVSIWGVVLGKYFAALSVFLVMIALTFIYPTILNFLVNDGGSIPVSVNIGGYIAFILLGAFFLSVGLFTSSLTENQVVAAVSGIVILVCMYFMQYLASSIGGVVGSALQWISPMARYNDFAAGAFNFASLIFYISLSAVFLFITVMNMERKRWS